MDESVFVLDARDGRVVQSAAIEAGSFDGWYPLMLTRSGRYLYLQADPAGSAARLAVYDMANNRVSLDPLTGKPCAARKLDSAAYLTGHGDRLYCLSYRDGGTMQVIDAEKRRVIREYRPRGLVLYSHYQAATVASRDGRRLNAVDAISNRLTVLDLDRGDVERSMDLDDLPPLSWRQPVAGALAALDRLIFPSAQAKWFPPYSYGMGDLILSGDGKRIYSSLFPYIERNLRMEPVRQGLWIVDTDTWRAAHLGKGEIFNRLALSLDGRHLYAISTEARRVTVVDTAGARVVRHIEGVGRTPAAVVVTVEQNVNHAGVVQ